MGNLKVELMPNGRTAKIHEGFKVNVDGVIIGVPDGFKTDFASTPRGLWNVFPPIDKYARAAVVHDWLYKIKTDNAWNKINRRQADEIFFKLMGRDKVPAWKKYIIWASVRAFGWIFWN